MATFIKNYNGERLLLIDGSSYLYRAFYGYPMTYNREGLPTNAVSGVLFMIASVIKTASTRRVIAVFDAEGKTFRNDIYPEYKANRPPTPEELKQQIPHVHKLIKKLGVPLLCVDNVEADDVIGTLAKQASKSGLEVIISTGDKDMAQLVDNNITLINTMTDVQTDLENIRERFGVKPSQFIDYLALMGDKSDNIPGINGVGKMTAVSLLSTFKTLDNIYESIDTIPVDELPITKSLANKLINSKSDAYLSKTLATIKCDVPLDKNFDEYVLGEWPDYDELYKVFYGYNFDEYDVGIIIDSFKIKEKANWHKATASLIICPNDAEYIRNTFDNVIEVTNQTDSLMFNATVDNEEEATVYVNPSEERDGPWVISFIISLAERFKGKLILPSKFKDDVFHVGYSAVLPPIAYPNITIVGDVGDSLQYLNAKPTDIRLVDVEAFMEKNKHIYPKERT